VSEFVEVPVSEHSFLTVERVPTDEIVVAGRLRDLAGEGVASLDDLLSGVRTASERVVDIARDAVHPPDEVTLEFAVQLASEAGVVIARASAAANLKVTFRWSVTGGGSRA
jgi:hypothetical protein